MANLENLSQKFPTENQESQVTMKTIGFSNSLNSFSPKLSIKLQEKNFLLWNQQVEGVILSHKLHKMVVNPRIPPMFKSSNDRLENLIYEAYEEWMVHDQTLFTWLLSIIYESVLPRLLSCKHAYEDMILEEKENQVEEEAKTGPTVQLGIDQLANYATTNNKTTTTAHTQDNAYLAHQDQLHIPQDLESQAWNLIFVSKFAKDNQVYFEFHPNACFMKSQESNHVLLKVVQLLNGNLSCFKTMKKTRLPFFRRVFREELTDSD
ncbi:hypothetical protein KIW84_064587 [Lathyrus oleraceus]|uniref:Uncharacterized protein n=1 Tax=Pisum sativum TaxID=3888 RepID=A0A9D4WD45_PEA|nr:hypothetical protein KIW84_064587 [Pisum sativum]